MTRFFDFLPKSSIYIKKLFPIKKFYLLEKLGSAFLENPKLQNFESQIMKFFLIALLMFIVFVYSVCVHSVFETVSF